MNSELNVNLSKRALKFLKKQNRETQLRIEQGIDDLCEIPPKGDIKKLIGRSNSLLLRIGSYRIIFELEYVEIVIYIREIDNSGNIY